VGTLLIFLSSDSDTSTPTAISELAGQLDVNIALKGYALVDHFLSTGGDSHDTLELPFPTFLSHVKNYFASS